MGVGRGNRPDHGPSFRIYYPLLVKAADQDRGARKCRGGAPGGRLTRGYRRVWAIALWFSPGGREGVSGWSSHLPVDRSTRGWRSPCDPTDCGHIELPRRPPHVRASSFRALEIPKPLVWSSARSVRTASFRKPQKGFHRRYLLELVSNLSTASEGVVLLELTLYYQRES